MTRRRSKARAVALLVLTAVFCLALVVFPMRRGRGAAADAGRPATSAASATSARQAAVDPEGVLRPAPADAGLVRKEGVPPTPAPAPDEEALEPPSLPTLVDVGVGYVKLGAFDDSKATFEATTDVRLRWTDPRLRYPASETFRGHKEWIGKAAEAQLAKIWTPNIEITNRSESLSDYVGHRLRIYPDGVVEVITRRELRHQVVVEPERFPFDEQRLFVVATVRDQTADEVRLRFEKEDVEFSHAGAEAKLDGWTLGLVNLHAELLPGWNGERYAQVTASLSARRDPGTSLAPVFIPLIASLLIPLLALWMNTATADGFEVEAFELANMGIGGLFSVIALSFAIYSSYGFLGSSDNTVTRLFGLNYATIAISLGVVIVFFRYQLLARLFNPHVQREAFVFLTWALPLLTLATSLAFVLVAAV